MTHTQEKGKLIGTEYHRHWIHQTNISKKLLYISSQNERKLRGESRATMNIQIEITHKEIEILELKSTIAEMKKISRVVQQ